MLLLAASSTVTQELYLDDKTMPHVYVIVNHIDLRQIIFLPHEQQIGRHLHKDLSFDEKTMPHVYVYIVSRIYGRLFLYPINSKSDATYTRTYLLMRKQCLMFMLLLAASERAEINPLKIKFRKDIVESYKPIVWAEPRPISMLQNVSHLSNNHLFLPHMLHCGLGVYT